MQQKRYHIICDLKNCNDKIKDKESVEEFIRKAVTSVEMSILKGPIVEDGLPENPGVSGFAIIDFSHISVHTFTKYDEALIDVFSCKEFDKEKLLAYCQDYFGATSEDSRIKEVWWG